MGNTIKNYQKKRRNTSRKAVKELSGVIHDAIIDKMNLPRDLKEKEREIYKLLS